MTLEIFSGTRVPVLLARAQAELGSNAIVVNIHRSRLPNGMSHFELTATDEDGDVPTFTISGGADAALFSLTAGFVVNLIKEITQLCDIRLRVDHAANFQAKTLSCPTQMRFQHLTNIEERILGSVPAGCSPGMRDLLGRMIRRDWKQRSSALQLMGHPVFAGT